MHVIPAKAGIQLTQLNWIPAFEAVSEVNFVSLRGAERRGNLANYLYYLDRHVGLKASSR